MRPLNAADRLFSGSGDSPGFEVAEEEALIAEIELSEREDDAAMQQMGFQSRDDNRPHFEPDASCVEFDMVRAELEEQKLVVKGLRRERDELTAKLTRLQHHPADGAVSTPVASPAPTSSPGSPDGSPVVVGSVSEWKMVVNLVTVGLGTGILS
eukprot:Hpha_TRINITY_DN17939_c0_g1::TRINITY_DN17939_c0_g1_i1::g.33828::m.33828